MLVAVTALGLSQATTVLQLSVPEWNPISVIPERSPAAEEQLLASLNLILIDDPSVQAVNAGSCTWLGFHNT